MVEQKELTRITQSRKNCTMNCAIQGVRLIWKQKIWLAICEFLFRDFPVNQFNFKFLHSISTFCTNFVFLHSKKFQVFALFGINWHAFSQSAWRNFCMYIIRTWNSQLSHEGSVLTTNHVREFCYWHNYNNNYYHNCKIYDNNEIMIFDKQFVFLFALCKF